MASRKTRENVARRTGHPSRRSFPHPSRTTDAAPGQSSLPTASKEPQASPSARSQAQEASDPTAAASRLQSGSQMRPPVAPMYPGAVEEQESMEPASNNWAGRKRTGSDLISDHRNPKSIRAGADSEGVELTSGTVSGQPPVRNHQRIMHHNPDLEPVPNVAIYNPKVQKAETDASNLAKRLLSIINSARIEDVQETVQKTLRPRFVRDPVSVVLHGETGTGKSFTLNNILGQRKIATQSGGTRGCTNVVTEYYYAGPSQELPFAGSVKLLTRGEATELVSSALASISECNKRLDEGSRDQSMFSPEDEREEDLRLSRESESAVELLHSLFLKDPDFRNLDCAREYLDIDSPDNPKASHCMALLEDIYSKLEDERITAIKAADKEAFTKRLEAFTTRNSNRPLPHTDLKCHPSPIVSKLEIGLNAQALELGVSIFDIPGVADTNTTHVRKARECLISADYIAVTGKLTRVAASDVVERELHDALGNLGSKNVLMICTHSDDGLSNSTGTVLKDDEQKMLNKVETDIEICKRKIINLENAILEARSGIQSQQTLDELWDEKDQQEKQQRKFENERFELQVLARNRLATKELKAKFQRRGKEPLLHVFCISNVEYDKYLVGYDAKNPPRLSLEATGIPALRRFIQSLPAKGRSNTLRQYICTHIPAMLNTVENWAHSTPSLHTESVTSRCESFRESAEKKVKRAYMLSQKYLDTAEQEWDDAEKNWISCAVAKCDDLVKKIQFNSRTFGYVLKKHGCHKVIKAGLKVDLNNDFMVAPISSFEPTFKKLQQAVEELRLRLEKPGISNIELLQKELLAYNAKNVTQVNQEFIANLELRKEEIRDSCQRVAEMLSKGLKDVRKHAISTHYPGYFDSYITNAYDLARSAKARRGQTLVAARSATFKAELQSPEGPFALLRKEVLEKVETAFNRSYGNMVKEVNNIFDAILFDADNACSDVRNYPSRETKELRKRLPADCDAFRKELKENIIPLLKEARAKSTPHGVGMAAQL